MSLHDLLISQQRNTRKRPSDEEHRIQTACVRWFNLTHKHLRGLLFAVPNGGRRDATTAAKLKAEGVVAGVSDLILLVPNKNHSALLIEMKTPTGRQSESQKRWQRSLHPTYKYILCRSLDDFMREVNNYLNDSI
ncbi:MAG: VRR-NUC domain-containing protein [Alloprevotella sp.]